MKKILIPLMAVVVAIPAISQTKKAQPAKPATAKPATAKPATANPLIFKTLKDSTSYSLGVNIARNLKAQNLDNIDAMLLYKGLSDVLLNKKVSLSDADASRCVNTYVQSMNSKKASGAKLEGQKFLAANAKKPGVISMPGGWQYQVIKGSESKEHPSPTDKVKVHYHGTLIDGTVFDSSVDRGEPISFGLNQVIKGWTMAVTQMTVGSKWKVFLPSDLAYGDDGSGDKIVGGSTLIFEIELLAIEK